MTTRVTITVGESGAWDVIVSDDYVGGEINEGVRVRQGETAEFWIHDGKGLSVKEVPAEVLDDAGTESEAEGEVATEGTEGSPSGD